MKTKGNTIVFLLIVAALIVAAMYFASQKQQSSQTPYQNVPLTTGAPVYGGGTKNQGLSLTVSSPLDGETVKSAVLQISGKTAANADVSVNDKDLTADAQGNFSTTVTLDGGENTINVVANDAQGNSAEKELTVTLQTM